MAAYTIKPLCCNNVNYSGLYMPYNEELTHLVKALPDARRSRTHSCRHIADTEVNLKSLHKLLDGKAAIDNKICNKNKQPASIPHPPAKREKDRVIQISGKMMEMLRGSYKMYRPKVWLFEGQKAGEQYPARTIQEVLHNALLTADIKKPVTPHWLRNSYATHLLEAGTDLSYTQALLGHKSSKTTEIYTYVTKKSLQKIKSPFDDL